MEDTASSYENTIQILILNTASEIITLLLLLVALVVLLKASFLLCKLNVSKSVKAMFPCVLISIVTHIFISIAEYYFDVEVFLIVEKTLLMLDSIILVVAAFSFKKLTQYVKHFHKNAQ